MKRNTDWGIHPIKVIPASDNMSKHETRIKLRVLLAPDVAIDTVDST